MNGNDSGPVQVARLVTCVDLDQDVPDSRWVSVSARQDAVLTTGHRVLLVDQRGWCDSGVATWADLCTQDIADTARTVVGPFIPGDGHPHPDLEAEHWTGLAAILGQHGVQVDAQYLPDLPTTLFSAHGFNGRSAATSPGTRPGGRGVTRPARCNERRCCAERASCPVPAQIPWATIKPLLLTGLPGCASPGLWWQGPAQRNQGGFLAQDGPQPRYVLDGRTSRGAAAMYTVDGVVEPGLASIR